MPHVDALGEQARELDEALRDELVEVELRQAALLQQARRQQQQLNESLKCRIPASRKAATQPTTIRPHISSEALCRCRLCIARQILGVNAHPQFIARILYMSTLSAFMSWGSSTSE